MCMSITKYEVPPRLNSRIAANPSQRIKPIAMLWIVLIHKMDLAEVDVFKASIYVAPRPIKKPR